MVELAIDTKAIVATAPGASLPHVQVSPQRVEIHMGETLRLYCRAGGTPSPGLTWKKRGGTLPPQVRNTNLHSLSSDLLPQLHHLCYEDCAELAVLCFLTVSSLSFFVFFCFCLFVFVPSCLFDVCRLFRPYLLTVSISLSPTVLMCYRDVLKSYRSVHLSTVCLSPRIIISPVSPRSPQSPSTKCMF